MKKNRNEEHEKVIKYMNKIARLCYSEQNAERQVVVTLLHYLTFKLNCKTITVYKDWLEKVRIKYQTNNTQQFNLTRKNTGSFYRKHMKI